MYPSFTSRTVVSRSADRADAGPERSLTPPVTRPEPTRGRDPPAPVHRAAGGDDRAGGAPRRVGARGARPAVRAARRPRRSRAASRRRRQAELLADRLQHEPIAAIYVTTLRRTHETAAPLARRLGLTPIEEPDLREVFLGEWEGGLFRRRAVANDPVFQEIFRAGALGRDPRRRAARRLRRAGLARLPAHRRRASRPAGDARRARRRDRPPPPPRHRLAPVRVLGGRQRVDQRGRRRARPRRPPPLQRRIPPRVERCVREPHVVWFSDASRRRASGGEGADQRGAVGAGSCGPGAAARSARRRSRGRFTGLSGCTPRRCDGMRSRSSIQR